MKITRLALHNYLTTAAQAYGERAHDLDTTPHTHAAAPLVQALRANCLQMISMTSMFAYHLEVIEEHCCCGGCGSAPAVTKFCTACGTARAPADAKFCHTCGAGY